MALNGLCIIAIALSAFHYSAAQDNQYIALIAPPAIYAGQPYSAFLTTSEFNQDIDIGLKLRTDESLNKIRTTQETKLNYLLTFKNAGAKVNKTIRGDKKEEFADKQLGYPLKIIARQNGKCISKEIKLVYAPTDLHAFIQLDKPFYKPGDTIRYRVVVFNHDTTPISINEILVEIKDGEGNKVETQNSLEDQKFNLKGLFEAKFPIDENPNLGFWTISTKVNGNDRLAAEKKFKVEKVKLPFFQVVIETEDIFHYNEGVFELKVFGKYAFGEYAKGTAQINITNVANGMSMYAERFRIETFRTELIRFKDDMRIKFMSMKSMDFNITVDFQDDALKTTQSKSKIIKILNQKNHLIEVFRPFPLEDGLDYAFDVVIRDYKGKIVNGGSEAVKMQCTIIMKEGNSIPVQSQHVFLENSVARFKIEIERGVKELQIQIEYLEAKTNLVVTPNVEISPALRVSVDPSFIDEGFEDDIQAYVQYSQPLFEVVALVIGKHGIVYSRPIDCFGDFQCNLYLEGIKKYYKEMMPEAKLAVYSIVHDERQVLYGSTLIKFGGISNNTLKITVPANSNPKKNVDLTFKSLPNSVVSLLAIDKKLLFVREGHDITKQDVITALTNTKRYAFMENKADDVIFDENNNNFIINLALRDWRRCSREENKFLDKISQDGTSGHKENILHLEGEDTTPDQIDLGYGQDQGDFEVRKNFLETWLFKTSKVDASGEGQMQLKTPDSITSWVFTGFSISDQGFAVAEPREIVSSQEFFVELNLPYSIRFGEILKLEVVAFNFMPEKFAGPVEVDLTVFAQYGSSPQQFEIVKYTSKDSCQTQPIETLNQKINFQVPHRNGVRKSFLVKPLVTKSMTIRVEATARNLYGTRITWKDTIVKKLIVENQGVAHFDTKNFEFGPKPFEATYYSHALNVTGVKNQEIDLSAVVTGSLMGPSLNLGSNLIIQPGHCGEQSMSRYRTTLWNYIYLKNVGKLSAGDAERGQTMLKKGYQNIMGYKNKDGGFRVWTGDGHQYERNTRDASSTWVTAYSAGVLGSSMKNNISPIDWSIVRNALKFCQGKQNPGGDFVEVSYTKNPTPNDKDRSRSIRIAAFVLVSFLTNRNYVEYNFEDVIKKGLDFIKQYTDYDNYAASISAYAMALANETERSESILVNLEKNSEGDGEKKYWNIEKGRKDTSPDTQILISSYVAMTYIYQNQLDKARPIIKWLMLQKNNQGGYGDSHSTAVAIETLAMMGLKTGADTDTKIHFEFYGKSDRRLEYDLNAGNAMKPHLMEMPKKTMNLTIMGVGKGYGVVTTYYEYFKIVEEISTFFRVDASASLEAGDYAKITTCFKRQIAKLGSDMVMMEFSLTSGYVYDADKTKPMEQDAEIRNIEVQRGGTAVNFYYEKVDLNVNNCVNIFAKKVYDIQDEKAASVKVYEYGNRDKTFASAFYNIGKPGCV